MKVESRIFELITVFFFITGIVYTVVSREVVGVVALFLTGGLSLIIGTYFRFVPGSYWPITVAGAAAILGVGLAFFYAWLIVIGVVVVLIAAGGLVFEYHIRPSEH
jgi:hypothetical protein